MIQTIQEMTQAQRVLDQGPVTAAKNIHRGQGRTSAALLQVLSEVAAGRHVTFVVLSSAHGAILTDTLSRLVRTPGLVTITPMAHCRFDPYTLSVTGNKPTTLIIDHAVIEKLEERRIRAVQNALFELGEWQAIATQRLKGAQ